MKELSMKTEKIVLDQWKYCKAGTNEFEPAVVPGDVAADYFRNRGITDHETGLNYKEYSFLVHESYEYVTEFDGGGLFASERVYLRCNGIDTFSEVLFNGVKLGDTDNMFRAYEWEIKHLLKKGANELKIRLKPYYETRKKNDGCFSIFEEDRIYTRKAQFHTGWDWAPFGVPAYGIFLPVEVWGESGAVIRDVRVKTKNSGEGVLFIELSEPAPGKKLVLKIGKERFSAVCSGRKNILCFRLEDPKLWYPNGYGRQDLYEYTLTLEGEDAYCGTFAFREVVLDESPLGADRLDFRILVNNVPVFCRGSNWVPFERLTGTASDGKYTRLLEAAAAANFNMLRVWGGGVYERDVFYEECDRLGIMVFQEVMFACSDIPADTGFQDSVIKELEYQLPRLRNHPCIVLWSGGNEMFNSFHCHIPMQGRRFAEYISRGMIASMTDTPYITASPFGYTDILNDLYSGDGHNNALENCIVKQNAELLRAEIRAPKARFTSECCMFGPGPYGSLVRYMPKEKLWPLNEVYDDRYMKNPYSDSPLNFAERELFMAEGLFGRCADAADFVKKGMAAQAEVLRAECDYMRAGHGTGFLTWMYDDCWPTGTWALIDDYLTPKAAYYALKRAFRPLAPLFTEEEEGTCTLVVANDHGEDKNLTVDYGVRRLSGETLVSKSKQICVPAYGTIRVERFAAPVGKGEYCFARLKGAEENDAVYFPRYWKDIPWKSDYDWAFFKDGSGYKIRITARAFVRMCNISVARAADLSLSDNYFDIEAGETKIIRIDTDQPVSKEDVTVRDWNSVWN